MYKTRNIFQTLLVFLALVLAVGISTASAEGLFVGSQEAGGSTYSYPGDRAMGMIVVAPDNITIDDMYAHVFGVQNSTQIRGVLYHKVDAGDWSFVAATDIATITAGWNHLTFPASVELVGGETYLLAHLTDNNRIMNYGGSGGARIWNVTVNFDDPESSGPKPVQLAYHYGTWAPYGDGPVSMPEPPTTFEPNSNQGLIAYFPMEGNAADVTQNGNDGLEIGNITYVEGAKGLAAHFDGGSEILIEDSTATDLESWTISFVMQAESLSNLPASPVAKLAQTWEGDAGNYNYAVTISPSGVVRGQYEVCGSNNDHYAVGSEVSLGDWMHVAVTRDAETGEHNIYINKVLVQSNVWKDTPCFQGASLTIGGKVTSQGNFFSGKLDEVRIYGRALTAGEIVALYNDTQSPIEPEPQSCAYEGWLDEKVEEAGLVYDAIGSIHAYPNLIWPPNKKDHTVILEGYFIDKLAMIRFDGKGVSDAYVMVDGQVVDLVMTEDGGKYTFFAETAVKAVKGSVYPVELYVIDTDGNPTLVDSTKISISHNQSKK